MTILEEIHALVDTMPTVTKSEAFSACLQLAERLERKEPLALACAYELMGAIATSDDPDRLRTLLVWMNHHGPLLLVDLPSPIPALRTAPTKDLVRE